MRLQSNIVNAQGCAECLNLSQYKQKRDYANNARHCHEDY